MKLLICLFALATTALSESNEELFRASSERFNSNFFQEVAKTKPGESFVLSAFSALPPLAQFGLASEGESHDEILKSIGLPNNEAIKAIFTDVTKQMRDVKGVQLNLANRVYVREGEVLNEKFGTELKEVFNSDMKNVDFTKSTDAANEINTWVEEKTNHRIKDLVSPDSLDASTAAVLVNAIYFKGMWAKPFLANKTQDLDFHVSKDETIKIPTMQKSENLRYGESKELDAKLLELPYEGEEMSFVIALPNEVDGIINLIKKLEIPSALQKAIDNMYFNEVDLELPKFKIETTTDLGSVLQKMGIEKLFKPDQARLDHLIKERSNLYVSSAIQKVFIEVNEKGAEAAASNAFGISYLSAIISEKKQFKADHPFVFYLKEGNNVLFSGVFQS